MKLVRRARKSIRERRMRACQRDLSSNLEKVESRLHQEKKKIIDERVADGDVAARIVIPPEVLRGVVDDELFQIECRLHAEAGLPPPERTVVNTMAANLSERQDPSVERMVGLVTFSSLVRIVRASQSKRRAM